jgi:hypothetical protein
MKFNIFPKRLRIKERRLLTKILDKLENVEVVYSPDHPNTKFKTLVDGRFFISITYYVSNDPDVNETGNEWRDPDYCLVNFDGIDVFEYSKTTKPKILINIKNGWQYHL